MMSENNIAWIDMEMTGLDPLSDHVLEIACIITDEKLNIISDELNIVVHQPDTILSQMNEWCMKHHAKSGLIKDSRSSTVSIHEAGEKKYMPQVNEHLHYRVIDVSSIKELAKRWKPDVYKSLPKKQLEHRALSDIKESISELTYYQKHLFML
ncbi:oligoribonuclease, mitochondrial isoform X2 [Ooceraea biroi]|uniref:oligoribonuclease, mitochondrial isoform X2 n=1 Tax=Ooceraea biroi TaxID=2015173 RepID=UPI0005B9C359|nr:oligoribonuclease, mitochondrial isoform X2 [Ooceraea biroi]